MCGVCGVVDLDETPDLDLVREMTRRLHHRGPDGHGHVRDDSAVLGHSRLSIVDVAGSPQPMSDEDGQVWVTFNGEIFNYVELRARLVARGSPGCSRGARAATRAGRGRRGSGRSPRPRDR